MTESPAPASKYGKTWYADRANFWIWDAMDELRHLERQHPYAVRQMVLKLMRASTFAQKAAECP